MIIIVNLLSFLPIVLELLKEQTESLIENNRYLYEDFKSNADATYAVF